MRQLGKREIDRARTLRYLTDDIEALVDQLAPDEDSIQAVVNVTETTPYIDASILNEFIVKAATRKGKKIRVVSVDLDNTKGEDSFEIFAKKAGEN
jgi:hypothetical protein